MEGHHSNGPNSSNTSKRFQINLDLETELSDNLQTEINRYFDNKVQPRKEKRKDAYDDVKPHLEAMAKYVHKQDPRFGSEFIKVGCHFNGLQDGNLIEYDINIELMALQEYFLESFPLYPGSLYQPSDGQPCPPLVFTFAPKSRIAPIWLESADVTNEGDIDPVSLKERLTKLLIEGVRNLGLRRSVKVQKKLNKSAIIMQMDGKNNIRMNLRVVINRRRNYPYYGQWPHQNTAWPSGQKKDIIGNTGVSFVTGSDHLWDNSSGLAEKELMRGIDKDGGCRKKCYQIVKNLNEDLWRADMKPISSYILKNLLFWECERYPHTADWGQLKLVERIISMTERLYDCICKRKVEMFFFSGRNLLENKETDVDGDQSALELAKERIEEFLNDPLKTIRQLNDVHLHGSNA